MVTNNAANFGTGTSGQVLTSNGAGVAPTFQAASTGNLVLIQSQTPSGAASVTFTTGISATYTTYLFVCSNITLSAGSALNLQVSTNGGSTYSSTNYLSGINYFGYSSAVLANVNQTTGVIVATGIGTTNAASGNGICWCYGIEAAVNPFFISDFSVKNNFREMGTATNTAATTVNAFKIFGDSGNVSGTISLFGVLE